MKVEAEKRDDVISLTIHLTSKEWELFSLSERLFISNVRENLRVWLQTRIDKKLKKKQPRYRCPVCGGPISYSAQLCLACIKKGREWVHSKGYQYRDEPYRKDLKELPHAGTDY